MRFPLRSLATGLLAVGVATCSDVAPVAPKHVAGPARLSFRPVFSKSAAAVYSQMSAFDVSFDHVHVLIVRPPSETVIDTTVFFTPNSSDLTLDFTVDVKGADEQFAGTMDYTNPTLGVVFHGSTVLTSYAPDQPAPAQQDMPIDYVGPGATVTRVVVAPKTMSLISPNTGAFTVQAFDANNAPVSNTPVVWIVSDPSVASIDGGVLTPLGKRGSITVTARTPKDVADNAAVTITLKPAGISVTAGGGQTGKVGTTLPVAGFVKVVASDGIGVQGITVNFAAPAGGKVGSASAVTDANGVASSTLTLGGTLGPQSFAATAAGFSTSITATATVGDPASIAAVSGDGQRDTVYKTLANELVVRVADAFSNPVPDATVSWARTAGTGAAAAPTSTTDASGQARMKYVLGNTPGIEIVSASVSGVSPAATFSEQTLAGVASGVSVISGDGQTSRAGAGYATPIVIRALDPKGNPLLNADVSWAATNATVAAAKTTTDAQGTTSNTFTAGPTAGLASVTATITGRTVTISATVQAGVVGKLVFSVAPPNGAAGQSLTPAVQVELQDAFGNRTAATNAVTIALGANPTGSTLNGTLTRLGVAGVATFDDLQLTKTGSGYTFVASSVGATSVTSPSFAVGAGTAAAVQVVAGDNQTTTVNTPVSVAPSVR
ncbi:MAG: Ig-like domain-containing protein, partial [Gemmatimonadaceae bacterium]